MPLIKVAYLMLNFLNLKSFLSNLFFCSSIQPQHAVVHVLGPIPLPQDIMKFVQLTIDGP